MALADQKCVPCKGETPPLSQEEIDKLRNEIPDWEITGDHIEKTYKFPNFVEAMKFANRITNIAQAEDHHPDLHISWGKVRVELTTHAINGLSANDFIVAAKIDRLEDTTGDKTSI